MEENNCGGGGGGGGGVVVKHKDQMELPPGFRFHPTDEELITQYLSKKVDDPNFSCVAIADVDMNKVEPWDLPWRAKLGEKEWYFFCVRDKKYPTGLRTNRATAAGYWKATGKDKEIFRGKTLVGMKKTLVFYMGRAPKGEKSNWVTHEYRLEAPISIPKPVKNDWVISRVFQKTSGGKKVHIDGLFGMRMGMNQFGDGLDLSPLPPLSEDGEPEGNQVRVTCFSSPIIAPLKSHQEDNTYFNNNNNQIMNPNITSFGTNPFQMGQFSQIQNGMGFQFPGSSTQMQDPAVLRNLIGNYGQYMNNIGLRKNQQMEVSVSHESPENSSVVSNMDMGKRLFEEVQEGPSTSIVHQDTDCIWGY